MAVGDGAPAAELGVTGDRDEFRGPDGRLLAAAGAALLLALLLAVLREAATAPSEGLDQIWIEPLSRVDRCVSCHRADAPAFLEAHGDLLDAHPPEEFGCTLCHGGQGPATRQADAHGDVPFWEEPLLDTRRARIHGVSRAQLMEMRCNACHRAQAEVRGMPTLNAAKQQVERKRCLRCHSIGGEGAFDAPDLTYEGDKHPTHYAFPDGWRGPRTALAWHVRHFTDPAAVVPGSAMPTWILPEGQAEALALLVLSWRRLDLPPRYWPR